MIEEVEFILRHYKLIVVLSLLILSFGLFYFLFGISTILLGNGKKHPWVYGFFPVILGDAFFLILALIFKKILIHFI